MTAHVADFWDRPVAVIETASLRIDETHWGFAVKDVARGLDTDSAAEMSLKFFAFVMIISAFALWALPASIFSGDVLMMKLGLTAMFGLIGFALFWHANRGFKSELQVDAVRREVRIATRNLAGQSRIRNRIPMRDIESCFLRQKDDPDAAAQLCFRVTGYAMPLLVAAAPENDLVPVLERLTRDLRNPRERLADRLAEHAAA